MNYSKGICWIDDCRIPFVDEKDLSNTINAKYTTNKNIQQSKDWGTKKIGNVSKAEGRFSANLLVSDDMLNDTSRYYDIDIWFNNLINNI